VASRSTVGRLTRNAESASFQRIDGYGIEKPFDVDDPAELIVLWHLIVVAKSV